MTMKLSPRSPASAAGHVLWMVLIGTAFLGLTVFSYLRLTQVQNTLSARSQVWNNCIPVIEAGIEEALAQLNRFGDSNLTANGWTPAGGGFYKQRAVGEGYYRVSVNYSNILFPTLVSSGHLPAPLTLARANTWLLAQAFTPDPAVRYISRTVRVTCRNEPLLGKALVAKNAIRLNGFNVLTDSYNSTNPLYSSAQGQYDPTKARANGDVAIDSGDLVNVGSLGNAKIMGSVHVGPEANLNLGPNGSVGDAAWVAGGSTGLQTNHFSKDANFLLPEVGAPWQGGAVPPTGGDGYKFRLYDGNYEMSGLKLLPAEKMAVYGNAVLFVKGDVDLRGQFEIIPPGRLTLYVSGASTLFGMALASPVRPADFVYYGLQSNTKVDVKCSGVPFNGVIYAPNADVTLTSQSSVSGSIVGKTITFNGNTAFHYDESLAGLGYRGYVITSWHEI
jgi:hypothetical protein